MEPGVEQPWLPGAIERLDARREDRVLAIDCDLAAARALRALVGRGGQLVFVLRDRATAEHLAALGAGSGRDFDVLAHRTDGSERFGSFDAVLVAPATGPLLPAADMAVLVRQNLRPGGRFVVDVPSLDLVPDLSAAWRDLDWDEDRLEPLRGLGDDHLAAALRAGGLRGVETMLGVHLLHTASAGELVAKFAAAVGLEPGREPELAHALVRRRGTAGAIDTLLHRTRVTGRR